MIKFKTALLAAVLTTSAIAASPAFAAAHWEVYDSATSTWSQNGTLTFTGPTTATVAFVPVPCSSATFTVTLTAGVAKVSGATFAGSTACAGIVAQNLSWGVSPPSLITGSSSANLTIGTASYLNTIQVQFSQPAATCSGGGTTSATVTNVNPNTGPAANNLTFAATFGTGPCTNVKSTGPLVSSKPFRYQP
jgi:hypothetical protein